MKFIKSLWTTIQNDSSLQIQGLHYIGRTEKYDTESLLTFVRLVMREKLSTIFSTPE